MHELVRDALSLAYEAHRNQFDKNGEQYILHVIRVSLHFGHDDDIIVALLHDIVEDTPYELHNLNFPAIYTTAVDAITRRRGESYNTYINRVSFNPIATRVKIADLLDNLDDKRMEKLSPATRKRLEKKYFWALGFLLDITRKGVV